MHSLFKLRYRKKIKHHCLSKQTVANNKLIIIASSLRIAKVIWETSNGCQFAWIRHVWAIRPLKFSKHWKWNSANLFKQTSAKRRIESRRNINHETSRWRAKIILHCCFFLRDSDSRWSYYCLITSRISISSDLRFWEHDLNRVKVAHTIFWQTCLQKTKQNKTTQAHFNRGRISRVWYQQRGKQGKWKFAF